MQERCAHLNDLEGLLVGGVLLKELSDRTNERKKKERKVRITSRLQVSSEKKDRLILHKRESGNEKTYRSEGRGQLVEGLENNKPEEAGELAESRRGTRASKSKSLHLFLSLPSTGERSSPARVRAQRLGTW